MTSTKSQKPSFEESIEKLENLVESMESGDIPLMDLIDQYEEGGKLLKQCQADLQKAAIRIEKITEEGVLESFND